MLVTRTLNSVSTHLACCALLSRQASAPIFGCSIFRAVVFRPALLYNKHAVAARVVVQFDGSWLLRDCSFSGCRALERRATHRVNHYRIPESSTVRRPCRPHGNTLHGRTLPKEHPQAQKSRHSCDHRPQLTMAPAAELQPAEAPKFFLNAQPKAAA